MNRAPNTIDHNAYQERLRRMPTEALQHIAIDAQEAIDAMPDNPKAGYYQDEILYCQAEIARRRRYATSHRRAAEIAHSAQHFLSVLAGDEVGTMAKTWQDAARTASMNLHSLADYLDQSAQAGEPEPGSVSVIAAIISGRE